MVIRASLGVQATREPQDRLAEQVWLVLLDQLERRVILELLEKAEEQVLLEQLVELVGMEQAALLELLDQVVDWD